MDTIKKAYEISKKELFECYEKKGIVAGRHHYLDYWTRDAYYGCVGAIELGNFDIVKKHIELLSKFQKSNGLIPFIIRRNLPGLSFFGIKKEIRLFPQYKSHKALFTSTVIDSNYYYIMLILNYYKCTNDETLLNKYTKQLHLAINWYIKKLNKKDFLLREGFIAQWNDGIYKLGKVFITNLQIWHVLTTYRKLTSNNQFLNTETKLHKALNGTFYNGKYFSDWVDYKKHDYFDSIANLLAIIWEFTTKEQAENIIRHTETNVYDGKMVKTSFPKYPRTRIELGNKLVGMGGYWKGKDIYWPEPTTLFVEALLSIGKRERAIKVLELFSNIITDHNGLFEVYRKQKSTYKPLQTKIYQSENPYARGAGLFIRAYNQLTK